MPVQKYFPDHHKVTLVFKEKEIEHAFRKSYDKDVKLPLRSGILISLLSWFSAIALIYAIIPDQMSSLGTQTVLVIGAFFGFIIYATYKKRFIGHYHFIGSLSNAWGGLYAVYFCHHFPNGVHLMLPVIIFIIFFGSYMIRLRWIAGFLAALSYIIGYQLYIIQATDLSREQVLLYSFVAWMTLIFALIAGHMMERNSRLAYIQSKTIREQAIIIEREKEVLLKEVHHRVKNNLQLIVSLINLQLSRSENGHVEAALKDTQGRVRSMSLVHHNINEASNFTSISFNGYTQQLIDNIKYLYVKEDVDFELDIPKSVSIDIEAAIPLGLIFNEILTNFYKHCEKIDQEKRRFFISVKATSDNTYAITYRDNGSGFPKEILTNELDSLGLELIQSLTEQLNGTFKYYNDNGAVYEIDIELEDL